MTYAPFAVSVETSDLDEARAVCGEHLYPRSLRLVDPDRQARLNARFAFFRMASLTLADVRYGAAVAGESDEFGSYHVNVPLTGGFAASQGGRAINGSPGLAGVYRPDEDNVLHYSTADCHMLALKVDREALEERLASVLDAPVRRPLRLAGELDVRRAPGRSCANLIRLMAAEMHNPTGLAFHPVASAPLEESLLLALLYAAGHQYQDALHRPERLSSRQRVARAIDAIHADPRHPHTAAGLAQIAGVSLRCLRQEFHRQVGESPMAYLRAVRMSRAHLDLRAADPATTSVAEVARRWGYVRPGRFAADYRARYHVLPAETLRGAR